ncbi:hypothetical protein CYMTET_54388 [Cymbomonas tetramitiformis]|uniref:Uncharacterized protein n=1 Tax=Cymbomonas tetramitiformis TaxID=36881 RepID=A0AAE0BF30_9CHLO|nr:hypothetical protein CYMTET_54388 [Cymbomonas tetramitiformis]
MLPYELNSGLVNIDPVSLANVDSNCSVDTPTAATGISTLEATETLEEAMLVMTTALELTPAEAAICALNEALNEAAHVEFEKLAMSRSEKAMLDDTTLTVTVPGGGGGGGSGGGGGGSGGGSGGGGGGAEDTVVGSTEGTGVVGGAVVGAAVETNDGDKVGEDVRSAVVGEAEVGKAVVGNPVGVAMGGFVAGDRVRDWVGGAEVGDPVVGTEVAGDRRKLDNLCVPCPATMATRFPRAPDISELESDVCRLCIVPTIGLSVLAPD